MTSASSVRSSSPTKGSAAAVSNENAGSGSTEKMKTQDASGSKGSLSTISTARSTTGSLTNDGSSEQLQKEHQEKLQALKQRKCDLEKLLGEKNLLLEQIQRQEQQIITGDYEFDTGFSKTSSLNIRKKISTTSFKLPSNNKGIYGAKERSGSVGDMEKKIRQEAMNGQSHKLSTIDFNVLKSKRNMVYGDCEPAMPISQQKLMPKLQVYHDMDCVSIVAQPITIDPPANYHNTSRSQELLDPNKNAGVMLMNHSPMINPNQSQRCSPVSMGGPANCGKFIGRINSTVSSNYSMVDRRSSIKSVQQVKTSPKQQRQDDRLSMIVNSNSLRNCTSGALTMPITRSDFDLSDVPFTNSSNFLYDYEIPALQVSTANVVYGNDLPDAGLPSFHLNSSSANHRLSSGSGKANSFLNVNSKVVNFDPLPGRMPPQEQYNQNDYDEALISHQHLMNTTSSNRRPIQMLTEVAHKRTFHNSMPGTSDGQPQPMGLGGFWKTLGKESVWCSVDKSYDSSSIQPNSTKPKKTNANMRTTPTKSISLGNFDVFNDSASRDEMIDKISISSMNSEGNKKQKEKQWLETSLDGPSMTLAAKHVSQQTPSPMHNLSAGQQTLPIPVVYAASPFNNGGQQALTAQSSPVVNRMKPGSQSLLGAANAKQDDCQLIRKSSTKATRSNNYGADVSDTHAPVQGHYGRVAASASESISLKMAQDAEPITGATALAKRKSPSLTPAHLHPMQINQPMHQQVVRGLQQKRSPALQFSSSPPQPPTIIMTNNPRSPINASNLPHYDSIRIESPKNMTVVQQAVFMPYKEVTKPFEMSDFYKYSTKFRQKDKQQQQQQQQQQQGQQPHPPSQQQHQHHLHQQNNHQPFLQKQVEVEQ